MPFAIFISPGTFIRQEEVIPLPGTWHLALFHVGNFVVLSRDQNEHISHEWSVLSLLQSPRVVINFKNSKLLTSKTDFRVQFIGPSRLKIATDTNEAIKRSQQQKSVGADVKPSSCL